MKKINVFLLIAVLVFAINTLPGILKGFSAFTYDNGRDMLKAYDIIYKHDLTLIGPTTGIPGVFHGAWSFYWQIIPYLLFGGHPIGIALGVAFLNLLGLIFFFVFVEKTINRNVALVSSLIYASSSHILAHSTQLAHNNLLPFWISLALLTLYINSKFNFRFKKAIVAFGLILGFLFEFEFGGGLFIFIFNSIFFSSMLYLKKKSIKDFIKNITIFIASLSIAFVPRILFEFRHGFSMTKALISNLINPEIRFYYFRNLSFIERVKDREKTFFDLWTGVFPDNLHFLAGALLVITVVGVILFLRRNKSENKFFLKYSLLQIVVVIGGFIYYKDAVWTTYTSGFPIYFLVVFSFSLGHYFVRFNLQKTLLLKILIIFFALLILSTTVWKNLIIAKGAIDDPSAISNQLAAINYIYSQEKTDNFAVGVYSPSWFSYPYDYWFQWREKFQNIKRPRSLWDAKINYLIREPGNEDVTEKQWFEKFMNKNAKYIDSVNFGKLKVEKWQLDQN
jgi:hypothetical protein